MAVSAQSSQRSPLPKPDQGKTRHAIEAPRADFNPSLRTKTSQFADAVVTPPASLETHGYRLNAYIFDGSSWVVVDRTLQIGIDGSDVYL